MFMDRDFLLETQTGKILFHDYAEDMPIVDYHCHINPKEIAENRKFENISQAWLEGDHYKWRLMRASGIQEKYITGDASDKEKFLSFAHIIEKAIGNPVYHWAHLELRRYFDCDIPLTSKTAEQIWDITKEKLQSDELSVRGIINQSKVTVIGTTDDPADDLYWHGFIRNERNVKHFNVKVVPTYRPDTAVNIEKDGYIDYIKKLSVTSRIDIKSLEDLYTALTKQLDFFVDNGCRASDHGLDYLPYVIGEPGQAEKIFIEALYGSKITPLQADVFKTAIMLFIGEELYKRGLVMQIHFNAVRNVNTRMFNKLGPNTGFDSIGNYDVNSEFAKFLNHLDSKGVLPKTVLYSLNPNDNTLLDSIAGCFPDDSVKNKVQHGSAWWFNDTKEGMIAQLTSLANTTSLGNFIGMLTDSRSFLSYTRHEYFRRILCNLIGKWVDNGEYPENIKFLGQLVKDISYNNAIEYFGFLE
ncbi:MAG: glucuronate isomerase [Clostridiales bacterium]|nr:glucuronate isomerase [Clostridiales bacterium]